MTDIESYLSKLLPFIVIVAMFIKSIDRKYMNESKIIKELLSIHVNSYLKGDYEYFIRVAINLYMYLVMMMLIFYIIIFGIRVIFSIKLFLKISKFIVIPLITIICIIMIYFLIKNVAYKKRQLRYRLVYKNTYTDSSFIIIKIIKNKMLVLSVNYYTEISVSGHKKRIRKSNIQDGQIISSYGYTYIKNVESLDYHPIIYVKNSLYHF